MLKVAITGSTGLIGTRLIELLKNDFDFIPLLQKEIDITNKLSVNKKISSIDFDILLHLAAYTNVDQAEKEREKAYNLNVNGTRYLFEAVKSKSKKFIYISTETVFDGKNPPYYEDSIPNPLGYYAQTKYEAEKIVKDKAMIVRIAYPYRTYFKIKPDFVWKIKSLLEDGKELFLMTDTKITLTFVDDIACALKYLLNNYSPEIFHIVGGNSLSPYDAGLLIAQKFKLNNKLIKSITYDEYMKNKAARPKYAEIKSKKNNFYKMKSFQEGLNYIF